MTIEIWPVIAISIPTMIFLGIRHALDVDHITAIDNLVRLYNMARKSKWIGTGFSIGHTASVLAEMIFIIYIIGSITNAASISLAGGVVGAIALGTIGAINIYSMKRWGNNSSTMLVSKILGKTRVFGPVKSAFVTGLVFGLGFDTATQISAIVLSAISSTTIGIQAAFIMAGFFAAGMIAIDTLDSVVLRSVFSKMRQANSFRFASYALSGTALVVASIASYNILTGTSTLPEMTGPILAISIMSLSFIHLLFTRKAKISMKHLK